MLAARRQDWGPGTTTPDAFVSVLVSPPTASPSTDGAMSAGCRAGEEADMRPGRDS